MDRIILILTLIASAIFAIQLILTLMGFDYDLEIEIEFGSFEFNFVSLKTICMFVLMFGWTYTICDNLIEPIRTLSSLVVGISSFLVLGYTIKKFLSNTKETYKEVDINKYINTRQVLITYYNNLGTTFIDGIEYDLVNESGGQYTSGDMVELKGVINKKTFKI